MLRRVDAKCFLVRVGEDGRRRDVGRVELEPVKDGLADHPAQRNEREGRGFVAVVGELATADVAVRAGEPDFAHVCVGVLVVAVGRPRFGNPRLILVSRSPFVLWVKRRMMSTAERSGEGRKGEPLG